MPKIRQRVGKNNHKFCMKKFFVILLLVLNVLPVLAYVRDDTNTGGGFLGAIFSIAAIIFFLIVFGKDDKNS